MNHQHPTGLGEPSSEGKMALFKPPHDPDDKTHERFDPSLGVHLVKDLAARRIRTTIDLTSEALVILQQVQQEHRLKTGRAMPVWRALSLVIVDYKNHHDL